MTMTYCKNCRSDIHITERDCCNDPKPAVPSELKACNVAEEEK